MIRHYLKIFWRNLRKYKFHSTLNILGLAVGIACCLLILLFVLDELSYDRFHEKSDRIHRLSLTLQPPGQEPKHTAITAYPMGPTLEEDIPEVMETARLMPYFEGGVPGRAAVSYRQQQRFYDRLFFADPAILEIFTLPMPRGNPETALNDPFTAVLTESAVRRYFGDADPIGKILRIDTGLSVDDYRVTGVVEDLPYDSHIHFDVLVSFSTLQHVKDERITLEGWWLYEVYTYLLLGPGVDAETVQAKLPAFIERHLGEPGVERVSLQLQPISDIHLHSDLLFEIEENSDISYVYIFSSIALIILLVACINFMNLSTARFSHRAREVGVRKVVGAHRSQIVRQFLGESILISAIATVVALAAVAFLLPAFNAFTGKQISLSFSLGTGVFLLTLVVVVGLLAGSYPALFLSAFRPTQVLKGTMAIGARSGLFRRFLIVLQFTVSITLIISALVVYSQLSYMRNQDPGYDRSRVVVVPIRDVTLRDRYLTVKDTLERLPTILDTSLSSLVLGRNTPGIMTRVDGAEDAMVLDTLVVDQDFLDMFDIPILTGRGFAREIDSDVTSAFMLNETAVRTLGWSEPEEVVGRAVNWGGFKKGQIIGVVKDFHFKSLEQEIEPLILHLRPIAFHYLFLKIPPEEANAALAAVEGAWNEVFPDKAFDYFFLEDELDRLYRAEERLGQVIGLFSLLAVFVACLGLFGLAAFTAERRTKEIGIRKVLGSSVAGVVTLLSKEFTTLVLVANVIAWPIAYWLLSRWLEGFAYRIDLGLGVFVTGGLLALVIAWLTVSYQSLRAALINPADALRYE